MSNLCSEYIYLGALRLGLLRVCTGAVRLQAYEFTVRAYTLAATGVPINTHVRMVVVR